MTDYQERFYELYQFLGGYFHQDWNDVMNWQGHEPNFEEIVRFYKNENPPDEVTKISDELRRFLALPLSEMELRKALQEFNVCYRPQYRGMDHRQWLEAVLGILEDPTATTSYLSYIEQPAWTGWEEYVDEETKRMLNIK